MIVMAFLGVKVIVSEVSFYRTMVNTEKLFICFRCRKQRINIMNFNLKNPYQVFKLQYF